MFNKLIFLLHFNPRSREGSDKVFLFLDWFKDISIHAPAKGATVFRDFQAKFFKFQSTLPRRERPLTEVIIPDALNFNPRSREGSD